MIDMTYKCYKDLKREVWDKDLCAGCGACVAVCPADSIIYPEGRLAISPENTGYCKWESDEVPCGACYAVCPRVSPPPTSTLGNYIEVVAAKAVSEVPGRQSGGAVTAILHHALSTGMIDAVVTIGGDRWTQRPASIVITSSEELVHQAGSRYSWWVPLLAALKTAVIEKKYKKIAVVGVPCVVQAINRMKSSEHDLLIPYSRSIRLIVGLFCTESFDYMALIKGKLRKEYGVETWNIERIDVRGKLDIRMRDGTAFSIPLKELEAVVRTGCHHCNDFTALFSDISAGSVGSPDGWTTLIIRNPTGKAFIESAVLSRELVITREVEIGAIEQLASRKIKSAAVE